MSQKSKMHKDYISWLVDFVASRKEYKNYYSLFNLLYFMEFTALHPKDDNRILDAYRLRSDYEDEIGITIKNEITILEVLVAFSIRVNSAMSIDIHDIDDMSEVHDVFWSMIFNLGFKSQSENNYDERICIKTINKMLNRQYEADGSNGGLFIIPDPPEDLREVELWWQYQWWYARQ